jgi:hypothetical protein
MDKVIKVILLMSNQILISQIEEISTELGEPDCRLIEPFLLNQSSLTLSPWLMDYTSDNKYMISSDKILTLADPNSELLEKYIKLTK